MPDVNMSTFEEVQRNQLVTEVDIQTQVALNDYQVKLSDIINPTQSQDNVVVDRFGEFLPHWNESLDFDTWVKMNMEVAGKRILMLRGNSSVSSVSNSDDVFIQYTGSNTVDDSGDFANNNIIPYSNVIYETSYKRISAVSNLLIGLSNVNGNTDDAIVLQAYTGETYHRISTYNEGSAIHYDQTAGDLSNSVFTRIKLELQSSTFSGFLDGILIGSGGRAITANENMSLFAKEFNAGSTGTQEWSFARKYTATEPTWLANDAPQNIAVALKSLGRAG